MENCLVQVWGKYKKENHLTAGAPDAFSTF